MSFFVFFDDSSNQIDDWTSNKYVFSHNMPTYVMTTKIRNHGPILHLTIHLLLAQEETGFHFFSRSFALDFGLGGRLLTFFLA